MSQRWLGRTRRHDQRVGAPADERGWLIRMMGWIDSLPEWLRPAIYGPALLAYGVLLKGGILLLPMAVYFVAAGAGRAVLQATALLAFIFASAAVAGLVYTVAGRPLRALPVVGRYAAGTATIYPYLAAVCVLINVSEGGQFFGPWPRSLVVVSVVCSVFFGSILGHHLFRD